MSFSKFAGICLALALLAGCGSSVTVKPPQSGPAEAAKAALKEVADTGVVGSGMLTIRENLEKLQGADPAKAGALMKDLDLLQKSRTPQQVQAKAREMMSRL